MICAGFGFRRAASVDSLHDAYAKASESGADRLATVNEKAGSEPFLEFARTLGLPVDSIGAEALRRQTTETASAASRAAFGTGSVAEASALAAAGPGARLIRPRVVSDDGMATCALAEGGKP